MLSVSFPKSPKFEQIDENSGRFIIEGCYPGYGTTLGNSLRRVLLSSLSGNAAVFVKIKGITHEFTTVKGVVEDAVQLMLNLKLVRFKLHGVDEATIFLKIKGEKLVTAKDFKTTSEIEVVNPNQHVATLTSSSAELDMEVKVEKGLGYVPVDQQSREEKEIGTIAIDAVYTPVRRVNFLIDNMRIGKRTDFDKITLEVVTDGSITPKEAYTQAVEILMSQYSAIATVSDKDAEVKDEVEMEDGVETTAENKVAENKEEDEDEDEDEEEVTISDLNLSTRTLNVLETNNIQNVKEIEVLSEEELKEMEGVGDKGIKEIKKAIGTLGITLKSNE
ncbi:MAG: DNA-directed RNA polymerase subunit alpha [Patescibacteria group bacterium]|nr:DNA-directed RNA polymerase subunit alpha [Patescibacteria group bacterium]